MTKVFVVLFCFHDPIHAADGPGDPLAFGVSVAAVRASLLEAFAWAGNHSSYQEHSPSSWWWFEIQSWSLIGDALGTERPETIGYVDWHGVSVQEPPVAGYPKGRATLTPLRKPGASK